MNEQKPQPAAGSAAVATLETRLTRIRESLAVQQAKMARGSRLTAVIGSGLCLLMAAYFGLFYVKVQEVMTPEKIIDAAEDKVVGALPGARKALEEKINDEADEWAAVLSETVQDNIPELREKIEVLIMNKAGESLDHFQVLTERRFRTFIAEPENKRMLTDGFASLKKREDAEQFVADLHTAIAKNMSGDVREQSEEFLHVVYQLNHKLTVLSDGKNLKGSQPNEREVLMIAKRLQAESAEDRPERPRKKLRLPKPEGDEPPSDDATAKPADATEQPAKDEKKGSDADKPAEKETKSGND